MLLEGPFESDYSLAIVNRRLALALLPQDGDSRSNCTSAITRRIILPEPRFLRLARNSLRDSSQPSQIPARMFTQDIFILPIPIRMVGKVRAVHCYGWEESSFPQAYVASFNRDLDVITVMSGYVKEVLIQNGVKIPIEIAGLGAEHILENPTEPVTCFEGGRFHFVHVSSCFPRKGTDVLVEAFCREFRRGQRVRLLIKTFANPHNEIEKTIAAACSRYPQHGPIKVIFDSWSLGQMRSLLEQADCLVAPSRGEGFGLPVAESMLLGTPVIATIHGGHADLCSPQWCWPVDFRLETGKSAFERRPFALGRAGSGFCCRHAMRGGVRTESRRHSAQNRPRQGPYRDSLYVGAGGATPYRRLHSCA